jgi:uncharacterized protein YecT (DUF1311 family)
MCVMLCAVVLWSGNLLADDGEDEPKSVDRIVSDVLADQHLCELNKFKRPECRNFKGLKFEEACYTWEHDDCYQAVLTVMERELEELYRQAQALSKSEWSRLSAERKKEDEMTEPKPEQAYLAWKKFRDIECKLAFMIDSHENKMTARPETICKVAMTHVRKRDFSSFLSAAKKRTGKSIEKR